MAEFTMWNNHAISERPQKSDQHLSRFELDKDMEAFSRSTDLGIICRNFLSDNNNVIPQKHVANYATQ